MKVIFNHSKLWIAIARHAFQWGDSNYLKYTGDVSLLLKQYIRIYESIVIFYTGPGGPSDYYAGFTMTLDAKCFFANYTDYFSYQFLELMYLFCVF